MMTLIKVIKDRLKDKEGVRKYDRHNCRGGNNPVEKVCSLTD